MSNYLDRATADARKVRDAVGAASEHGQKAAEEALGAFTRAAERARDSLETLLVQAKPYIRQARPYLHDAHEYFEKSRRRMSGRDFDLERPVVLTLASVGAVVLLALLLAPKQAKLSGAPDQHGA
jgi:hypothetical protein